MWGEVGEEAGELFVSEGLSLPAGTAAGAFDTSGGRTAYALVGHCMREHPPQYGEDSTPGGGGDSLTGQVAQPACDVGRGDATDSPFCKSGRD